jgi:hypothetical protein
MNVVPYLPFYQHANFGKFWSNIRGFFSLQFSSFGKYKKPFVSGLSSKQCDPVTNWLAPHSKSWPRPTGQRPEGRWNRRAACHRFCLDAGICHRLEGPAPTLSLSLPYKRRQRLEIFPPSLRFCFPFAVVLLRYLAIPFALIILTS